MQFSNPYALWLLIGVVIPFFVMWLADTRYQIYLASALKNKNSHILSWIRAFLASILILGLVGILANPIHIKSIQNPLKNGMDIIFVMDLSKSMLAEDIAPNRINAGKRVLINFIAERPNDRIGLVGFAGKPFVFSPLTFDQKNLISLVNDITVDSIKQEIPGFSGTAIGDALLLATDTLANDIPERKKIIILLTDGEANVGIDPQIANEYVKKTGTIVHTIGIGDIAGTDLYTTDGYGKKLYFMDRNGTPIHASIDEKLLKKIAFDNHGVYSNATTLRSMEKALEDLNLLHGKTLQGEPEITIRSYAPYLAYVTILIFIFWLTLEAVSITSAFYFQRFMGIILTPESSNFIKLRSLVWTKGISVFLGILGLAYGGFMYQYTPPLGNISILIDGSKSMLVEDVGSSRFALAKEIAKKIIDQYSGSPIRISLFGGDVQTLVPSTYDSTILKQNLDSISLNHLTGGSDIIGSIRTFLSSISEDTGKIFVISDGEIMGNRVDLKDTFLDIPKDISLWTIGVGTTDGGYIPLGKDLFGAPIVKQIDGNPVVSRYTSELLKKIVRNGGKYQHISDIDEVSFGTPSNRIKNSKNYSENILIFGIVFLFIGLILPYRKRIIQ